MFTLAFGKVAKDTLYLQRKLMGMVIYTFSNHTVVSIELNAWESSSYVVSLKNYENLVII